MTVLVALLAGCNDDEQEGGFSTAELLGNAALGIAALVVIWAAMTGIGEQVITYIRGAIIGG